MGSGDMWVRELIAQAKRKGELELNLSFNELKEVPEEILDLTQLRSLNLSNNHLNQLTEGMREANSIALAQPQWQLL